MKAAKLLLILIVALSLAACGGRDARNNAADEPVETEAAEPQVAEPTPEPNATEEPLPTAAPTQDLSEVEGLFDEVDQLLGDLEATNAAADDLSDGP